MLRKLTKELKYLYNENYKTLKKSNNFKEFKDKNRNKLKTNKQKNIPCSV